MLGDCARCQSRVWSEQCLETYPGMPAMRFEARDEEDILGL